MLLREFRTPREMGFNREPIENGCRSEVRGDQVCTASSVDLYLSRALRQRARTRRLGATVEIPTRRLIFDAVIQQNPLPNARLEFRACDPAFRGRVECPAPERDLDPRSLVESMPDHPRGNADLRSSRLPRLAELLEHVCDRMFGNPREVRACRCEMRYPMHGGQVMTLIHGDELATSTRHNAPTPASPFTMPTPHERPQARNLPRRSSPSPQTVNILFGICRETCRVRSLFAISS